MFKKKKKTEMFKTFLKKCTTRRKEVNYPWSKDRWACDYPVVRYKLLPLIRCGFRGVALMG